MVRQLIFKCIHALVDLAFRYCISVGKFILQYIGKMYEMNFAIMETPGGNTYMCQCVVCIYLLTVILIVVAVYVCQTESMCTMSIFITTLRSQ